MLLGVRQPALLAVVLVMIGCKGSTPGVRDDEAGPAPPCSINGMLFRDTPATEFTQCGKASPPFEGEVLECMKSAMADERPFVVSIETPSLVPASRNPALVGAPFQAGFRLRTYAAPEEGLGRRDPVALILTSPDTTRVEMNVSIGKTRHCMLGKAAPDANDPRWVDVNADGRHRFHAGKCLEWFDAAAWKDQPWVSRFDASAQLACDAR